MHAFAIPFQQSERRRRREVGIYLVVAAGLKRHQHTLYVGVNFLRSARRAKWEVGRLVRLWNIQEDARDAHPPSG